MQSFNLGPDPEIMINLRSLNLAQSRILYSQQQKQTKTTIQLIKYTSSGQDLQATYHEDSTLKRISSQVILQNHHQVVCFILQLIEMGGGGPKKGCVCQCTMSCVLMMQISEEQQHRSYLKADPKATRWFSCQRISPKLLQNLIQEEKKKLEMSIQKKEIHEQQ